MEHTKVAKIIAGHPVLNSVDRIVPLKGGQSPDEKFILYRKKQEAFIMRLAPLKKYDKFKKVAKIVKHFHKHGVKCINPVLLGKTSDHQYCYFVVEYLKGRSSESVLPYLSKNEQQEIGIAAGEELRKLHKLKSPKNNKNWFELRYLKFREQLKNFRELKLTFYKEKYVLDYIYEHLHLMKGRPFRFQHNDYNVRNIIVNNNKFKGIIDFDAYKWGDPLHDFYKLPWGTKNCSPWFAKGIIIGYCGGSIPDSFWELYNLYVMLNLHRRLIWAYQKKPSRIKLRLKIIEDIIKDHDWKSNKAPLWFKS